MCFFVQNRPVYNSQNKAIWSNMSVWTKAYDKSFLFKRPCKQVKLATVVVGDPKAPFSIATTPICRGGCNSFPWIARLYPWSLPYNAEC